MTESTDTARSPILIIDDDKKFCELISDYLDPFGYSVDMANNGQLGLEMAFKTQYDAILLDVMMPTIDGFDVLKAIRRESNVPVLMLTARGDEMDRIVGLEIGADDYLPKTYSTRELLARLRAVTRRNMHRSESSDEQIDHPFSVGMLRIDPEARQAYLRSEFLDLTTIEFDLLLCMVRAQGRVLSRDQLLDKISGRDYDVFDRSVDVHVSSLRKKLGDSPKSPQYIKTIRSIGYMFLKQEPEEA